MSRARAATAAASVAATLLGVVILVAPFESGVPAAWFVLRAGLVLCTAIAWLVSLPAGPDRRRVGVVSTVAVALWFGIEGLSAVGVLHVVAPFTSWQRVGDVGLVALAFIAAKRTSTGHPLRSRSFLVLVLLSAVLPAARACLELTGNLVGDGSGRASFPYANANALAGLFDLAIPMAAALALFGRGQRRLWGLGLAVFFAVAQAATFSRGAQGATAVAILLLIVYWVRLGSGRGRAARTGVALTIALVAIGFAGVMLTSSPRLRGDLQTRLERTLQADQSSTLRVVVWRGALALVARHPVLGVGPGQVGNLLVGTRPEQGQNVAERDLQTSIGHAHDDVLQVAAEAGLAAAAAFLVFWISGIARLLRVVDGAEPLRTGAALGVLALLLHGLVDVNLSLVTGNAVLAAVVLGAGAGRSRSLGAAR